MGNNTLPRRKGKRQHHPKKEMKIASHKERNHHPVKEGRETVASLQRRRRGTASRRESCREVRESTKMKSLMKLMEAAGTDDS